MLCASRRTSPSTPGADISITGTFWAPRHRPAPAAPPGDAGEMRFGAKTGGFVGPGGQPTYPLADGVVLDGQLVALGAALSQQVLEARQLLLQDAVLLLEGQQRGHGPGDGRCGRGQGSGDGSGRRRGPCALPPRAALFPRPLLPPAANSSPPPQAGSPSAAQPRFLQAQNPKSATAKPAGAFGQRQICSGFRRCSFVTADLQQFGPLYFLPWQPPRPQVLQLQIFAKPAANLPTAAPELLGGCSRERRSELPPRSQPPTSACSWAPPLSSALSRPVPPSQPGFWGFASALQAESGCMARISPKSSPSPPRLGPSSSWPCPHASGVLTPPPSAAAAFAEKPRDICKAKVLQIRTSKRGFLLAEQEGRRILW